MSKKLIYLISFVLVLGLAGNALAEDRNPPYWAGAVDSSYVEYEFNGNFDPEPGAYGVSGDNTDWIFSIGPFNFEAEPGTAEKTGWGAFGMDNFGDTVGKKFMRVQMTYKYDPDLLGGGYGETYDGMHLFGEGGGEQGWWGTEIPILEDTDEGDGWRYTCWEIHFEGFNPTFEEIYMGTSEFASLEPGQLYIDEIVIDTICYEGDDPPAGPGRGADMSDGLLVWHDFDNLIDGSGNGHDAVLSGDAYISGGLLYLDGTEDYADIGTPAGFGAVNPCGGTADYTIAIAYACTNTAQGTEMGNSMLVAIGPQEGGYADVSLFTNNYGQYSDVWMVGPAGADTQSTVPFSDGELHWAVVTYEAATDTFTFYDIEIGSAVEFASGAIGYDQDYSTYSPRLGVGHPGVEGDIGPPGEGLYVHLDGEIDMFAIWNRALATSEMPEIAEYSPEPSGNAHSPSPADNATDVPPSVVLSWTPGPFADKHDVYFGTDETKVTDANTTVQLGVLESLGQTENYYPTAGALDLDFGQTYYWRIDEVADPCMWKGNVWQFTTELPPSASNPNPQDGATGLPQDLILSWTPDPYADKHDVYFGTDETKVTDANTTVQLGVLVSQGQTENYYPTVGTLDLDLGQTYYWRIDEVNDPCMWKGNVWNFAISEYLVVDDMESYGGADVLGEPGSRICYTWKDGQGWRRPRPRNRGNGTGSIIGHEDPPYVETVITHGGGQSMPYYYDSDAHSKLDYYSEASANTLDLSIGSKDWSETKALVLYFYGQSGNDATEQMYVALEDADSNAVVEYDGDMNDIKIEDWQEWNIALQDFSDQGVNLADVNNIYIGFGDRDNPQLGGLGLVFFDDIRLYPTRCVLSLRSDDFARVDYVEDCVIDYKELALMAGDWLMGDGSIAFVDPDGYTEPPRENLLVEYTFNTNDLTDTSNNGYHGIGQNGPSVHDGILTLDGTNFVDIPFDGNNPFDGSQDFSIVMEFRTDQPSILISSARDNTPDNHAMSVYMLTNEWEGEVVYDNFWRGAAGAGGETGTGRNPGDGEWHIFAVTYDAEEFDEFIDIHLWDGEDWSWQAWWDPNIPAIEEDTVRIGGSLNAEFPYELDVGDFVGDFDGIRIYDKVLTESEILWLADTTDPKYSPLVSVANLYDEEPENSKMINFKDFAVIADEWLVYQPFP